MNDYIYMLGLAIALTIGVYMGYSVNQDLDAGIYIDEVDYCGDHYNYDTNVGLNFSSTTKYNIGDRVMIVKQAKK